MDAAQSKSSDRELDGSKTNSKEENNSGMETNEVTNENNHNVEDTSGGALDSKAATIEVTVDNSDLNIPSNTYKTCTGSFF